jgi:hypothetical protein
VNTIDEDIARLFEMEPDDPERPEVERRIEQYRQDEERLIAAEPDSGDAVDAIEVKARAPYDNVVTINNCTFAFVCKKKWSQLLVDPSDENRRTCNVCNKYVYWCKTSDEFARRGIEGECVAINIGDQHQPEKELLGVPAED